MELEAFWGLVEAADAQAGGDMERKSEALKTAIGRLSREDAIDFSRSFDAAMDRAYTWSLWGAAYVINGGCSDDGFADFRASLISRGRVAFERALEDPESLADERFDPEAWFFEGYQYAVTDGVEAAAGLIPERATPHPDSPSGEEWSEEEVRDLFPRLRQPVEAARPHAGGRTRWVIGVLVGLVLYGAFIALCFYIEIAAHARWQVPSKADIAAIDDRVARLRAETVRGLALAEMEEWPPYAIYSTGLLIAVTLGPVLALVVGGVVVWRGVRRDSVLSTGPIVVGTLLCVVAVLALVGGPAVAAQRYVERQRTGFEVGGRGHSPLFAHETGWRLGGVDGSSGGRVAARRVLDPEHDEL